MRQHPDAAAALSHRGRYTNLLQAERGFRDLRSTLDIRPMYHRVEPRIRAHVLISWLAYS